MGARFRYSRWDGTQAGFQLEAADVLKEVAGDALYHGDLNAALRRLMQSGFDGPGDERIQGVREVLEQVRRRRREELNRVKDMLAALNGMLEQRAAGEQPDFAGFMAEYGDFFPDNPQTLDQLLEQMAAQMAASEEMLRSMSDEQRAQLQALTEQLLADVDLRWQMDQLARNLQGAIPAEAWEKAYRLASQHPLGMGEMLQLTPRLGALDQLENLLTSAGTPAALSEADFDAARGLLGDDEARSLERLSQLTRLLEEAGLINNREGRLQLTPAGLRAIGQRALAELFAGIDKDRFGRHPVAREGFGQERTYESKPYEYGDPFNLDIARTIRNAVARTGAGTPVVLSPGDFEVDRTEALTRASTVVLLDLSLSMPINDSFLAAKKVAIALHALIASQFPRDFLAVVGFSEVARVLRPEQLPELSWDFVFGTNMQHALMLARQLLTGESGTRQIIMVTDGEPTAHLVPGGEPFFSYPPAPETIEATLGEVARCTAEGIVINTFMLDATPHLQAFVERIARMNGGRVFFTTPDTLGRYVLVDFLSARANRASRRTGKGGLRRA